jgi:hypothetical protein
MNRKLLETSRCWVESWLLLGILVCPAISQVPRYSLREQQTAHKTIVTVYQSKTNRPVWSRTFQSVSGTYPDNGSFFWSSNHQEVAFSTDSDTKKAPPSERILLVTWRAGKRVHLVPIHPLKGEGFEYVEDMTWSPGNDYLLVRLGGSGMADGDSGWVQCFDLKRHRVYFLGDSTGKPHWVNRSVVWFWPKYSTSNVADSGDRPTPQLWRVPEA